MILDYTENRSVTVRQGASGSWRAEATVNDSLLEARLTLEIVPPDLSIKGAQYEELRSSLRFPDMKAKVERLKGVRVGPGMTKIITGVLSGQHGSASLVKMALEAMEAVILAYTAQEFQTKGFQSPV